MSNAQAVRDELNARDRYRARRPLVMLGVVAPILLTAAMVPIFVNALSKNLLITEQEITQRALESDALSARLQAAAVVAARAVARVGAREPREGFLVAAAGAVHGDGDDRTAGFFRAQSAVVQHLDGVFGATRFSADLLKGAGLAEARLQELIDSRHGLGTKIRVTLDPYLVAAWAAG